MLLIAHGEDKPGPNGGYIRMPSNFHTEVVPDGESKIKVYLLDINWKNPTLRQSHVKAILAEKKSSTPLSCEVQTDYFLCTLPKGKNFKAGRLEIDATREKQKGALAIYDLPFSFTKADSGHKGHH